MASVSIQQRRRARRLRRLRLRILFMVILFELTLCVGFLTGRASAMHAGYPASVSGAAGISSDAGASKADPEALGQAVLSQSTSEIHNNSGDSWMLLLVNRENPLSGDFTVPKLTQLRNGHAIDSRAYPSLQLMMDAARAEGLDPLICSSFRTWDRQEELYNNKVQSLLAQGLSQKEAEKQAAVWVAIPGTSEHQAGLAVDIVDTGYQQLDSKQENTAVQKWLMEHCAEYGFILRYPTDKSSITGIGYEPWHYRYVGEKAAREIMEKGICLEEYLQ